MSLKDLIGSLDQSELYHKILEFPAQLLRGWEIGEKNQEMTDMKKCKAIVLSGMGGSAIGGDIIRSLWSDTLPVPLIVNRSYRLPCFCDSRTLVIVSSYSGNTEETLNAFEDAQKKKCWIICMTSGGRLAEITKQNKFPLLLLPQGYPPRAALGYGLGILFSFFRKYGFVQITYEELADSVSFLERIGNEWKETVNSNNLPLHLAGKIQGNIPLIYSSVGLEGVGLRWKMQFNENSKTHAFYFPIPEMNHNEITAWESLPGTERFLSHMVAVFLHISGDHPRINLRIDITKELVQKKGGKILEVNAKGTTFLSQLLYLIYFGDWVSYYLAMLYHVDPTVIQNINDLKDRLSKNL